MHISSIEFKLDLRYNLIISILYSLLKYLFFKKNHPLESVQVNVHLDGVKLSTLKLKKSSIPKEILGRSLVGTIWMKNKFKSNIMRQ